MIEIIWVEYKCCFAFLAILGFLRLSTLLVNDMQPIDWRVEITKGEIVDEPPQDIVN